jgi:TctA family transporter
MIELSLRQSLAMSDGQYAIFVRRPIAAVLLGLGAGLVALNLVSWMSQRLAWAAAHPPRRERRGGMTALQLVACGFPLRC